MTKIRVVLYQCNVRLNMMIGKFEYSPTMSPKEFKEANPICEHWNLGDIMHKMEDLYVERLFISF